MSANNSISQLLEQFVELYNNALATYQQTNTAITTDKDSVVINLYDPSTTNVTTVQVPSFGFLKREIERLSNNVNNLSAIGNSTANIQLSDGTYRRVMTSKLDGPAPTITSLYTPTAFETKNNQFFQNFLNPLLTITMDVSNQIAVNTEKIYVERYIFNSADQTSSAAFDNNYKGSNSIDYKTFLTQLSQNSYQYTLDSNTVDMPAKMVQYYGDLDVISVDNVQVTQIVNGVSQTNTVRLFTLNKLTYSDSSKTLQDTETLKVGDSLVVNSGNLATRYTVQSINSSTSQVSLLLVEGSEPIKIGASQLTIYKDNSIATDIKLNINFDERQVVFVKAIDPVSKIEAANFSPGVAFYSNDLQITMADGSVVTLADYYKSEVADFGQFIKSLQVDFIPPAAMAVPPDAPVLDVNNFKVVQINNHLTDNDSTIKITQLQSDKAAAEQSLAQLDTSIAQKKTQINTQKYTSSVDKDRDTNEYNALVSQRATESNLYASIVTQIQTIAASNNLTNVAPKFSVRGFWSVPLPKNVANTVPQEVVQFKIRYRYLSVNGKTSQVDQIPFNDSTTNTVKTAAFSNWNEILGPVRQRALDPTTGKYKWQNENEEDAQTVNFNSLDIPIESGEAVEIMIASRSEAGFPSNPAESEFSSIVQIVFPEGQFTGDKLLDAINQNQTDLVKVQVDQDLTTGGVYTHIGDSFTANSKYFAHIGTSIASGFLDANQNPVSVFDKLIELQNQIQTLTAQIAGTLGELSVYLEDQNGTQTVVSNNTSVQLFAGYYVDEITSQTNRKGAIVTKSFKLKLANTKATNLELVARILGDRTQPIYNSGKSATLGVSANGTTTPDSAVATNTYYTTEGNYDLVPLLYQNLAAADISANIFFNQIPLQSGQLRGQFVNSRFRNLANDTDLYSLTAPDLSITTGIDDYEYGLSNIFTGVTIDPTSKERNYSAASSTPFDAPTDPTVLANAFIWTGSFNSTTPAITIIDLAGATNPISSSAYDNGIFIHKDHPILSNGAITPLQIQGAGMVAMSKNAPRRANMADGGFQNPYKYTTWVNDANNTVHRTLKMAFDANDQYLLGGQSCGAYLYVAPLQNTSLIVDADNKFGVKTIASGATNAVSVDLIFQYRMTDYYGIADSTVSTTATAANNTGRIGGIYSNTLTNITYSKKIGIDILDAAGNSFQFDVEVYAKYKQEGSSSTNVTSAMLNNYNAPSSGGGGCPTPNMRILTGSNTLVPAGDLKIGDLVYTKHELTGVWGTYPLINTSRGIQPIVLVSAGGSNVTVSNSHKFLTEAGEYVSISDLHVGDKIQSENGIVTITYKQAVGNAEIVKLEIGNAHTYVVEGLVSHNKNIGQFADSNDFSTPGEMSVLR